MLRNLQIKPNKPVYTMYKAESNMVTGMGVVIDRVTNTVGFPQAETTENIFITDKERIPTGINTARGDLSDYEEEFVTIKKDDFAKIHTPDGGERRATDQFVSDGLAVNDAMSVGTDGKWKKATAGLKSNYIFAGYHIDNGHELVIIDIVNNQISN